MSDRLKILEFSLDLEEIVTQIVLNSFYIPKSNKKLLKYFSKKSIMEKVKILEDFDLIDSILTKQIILFFKIRNELIHNKTTEQLCELSDSLIKELCNLSKTAPKNVGFKLYKSYVAAIYRLFKEMPKYKIPKATIEKLKSKYNELTHEEIELKYPELFDEKKVLLVGRIKILNLIYINT